MKTKVSRNWFKIGTASPMFVYMDFVLRFPIACIETVYDIDESVPSWMPNANEQVCKLVASSHGGRKEFLVNPEDEVGSSQLIQDAMDWCEDTTIPPIVKLGRITFLLKCLMFWKYECLRIDGKIVGLKDKREGAHNE